ncbi:Nucleoside diphosphate kinase B [Galemys pyrenaicus]|uniref:Nucleoside diphosphate kinase n=1 Tax=Galemys pyrenaicus TaxID=202257 RepID=A0A8J5ZQ97_GALPY|nr:Nucleoside diphosphate kinase B [Galemys pyrenaicus]
MPRVPAALGAGAGAPACGGGKWGGRGPAGAHVVSRAGGRGPGAACVRAARGLTGPLARRTMANTERTFIAIKPDGVQRGLVGEIIKRFEQKGFRLVAMKFLQVTRHPLTLAAELRFFLFLERLVWEGLNVVKTGRVMLGETNPADSKPGTIRGDFCIQVGRNIIHGSDSVKSAEKEISLWFKPEELVNYKSCAFDWIYE